MAKRQGTNFNFLLDSDKNLRGVNLISRTADGGTVYYLHNGHNDVTMLADDQGVVVATYIAENYAWESAAWFWGTYTLGWSGSEDVLNNLVSKYGSSLDVFLITQCYVYGGNVPKIYGENTRMSVGVRNEVLAGRKWGVQGNKLTVSGRGDYEAPDGWSGRQRAYNNVMYNYR